MREKVDFYLLSDGSCDVLIQNINDAISHFNVFEKNILPFAFITQEKCDEVLEKIHDSKKPFILYNISDSSLRDKIRKSCDKVNIPCLAMISHIIRAIASYCHHKPIKFESSAFLTESYYRRIEAMNYMLSHDDGHNMWDLDEADLVLIGVSRTSKSPTSVYLSYQGYRVANIPFVHEVALPENLFTLKKPIFGLFIQPETLIKIRRNRKIFRNIKYTDKDLVVQELMSSKNVFLENKWNIIDVTNRSIEEVASEILQFMD